jgi:DNA-binding CsgD family transcriptional regulator
MDKKIVTATNGLVLGRLAAGVHAPKYTPPGPQELKGLALTAREVEVANLLLLSLANKEIAARLFISEKTVLAHLSRIYRKLGTSGRVGAALAFIESGKSNYYKQAGSFKDFWF